MFELSLHGNASNTTRSSSLIAEVLCLCFSENVATLFRASTLSTMLMDQFMKLTASDYLRLILKDPIKKIMECPDSCEVKMNKKN